MFKYNYISSLKHSPGWPKDKRLKQGPVAVIECIEQIPCNPCETVCPNDAITVGDPITNIPRFDGKCTGCGRCVAACPGLAIFLIDYTYSATEASITIPYEFLPLPDIGQVVSGLDREGSYVCNAKVIKVMANKSYNKTNLVTLVVPKKYYDRVRFFKTQRKTNEQKSKQQ